MEAFLTVIMCICLPIVAATIVSYVFCRKAFRMTYMLLDDAIRKMEEDE